MDQAQIRPSPLGRSLEEWQARVVKRGMPKYRGAQVFRWLHRSGSIDTHAMSNLPPNLRGELAAELREEVLEEGSCASTHDGVQKLAWRLYDGAVIETVRIPWKHQTWQDPTSHCTAPNEEVNAYSICVSSQVGCAIGCPFCASGAGGLVRNLTAGEIVRQVYATCQRAQPHETLRGIVFMGMGEPLHNYREVARAIQLLTHEEGLALSPRRITISTSGLVPQMLRLAQEFHGRINLAVSLHAPNDMLRHKLVPVAKRYPIADLMQAIQRYTQSSQQRVTLEYTLIRDLNDSADHARQLAKLVRSVRCRINLIPMNPVANSDWQAPTEAAVQRFWSMLHHGGVAAFVRKVRGNSIDAACGQLALREGKRLREGVVPLRLARP